MSKFIIQGKAQLEGEIEVSGAKNHALKCLAIPLITNGPCTITHVPNIEDVHVEIDILREIGAKIEYNPAQGIVAMDAAGVTTSDLPKSRMRELRAAVILSGALLARFQKVYLPHPGGDLIGKRPIDIFLEGYQALGAEVTPADGGYQISAPYGLRGARFVLRRVSVTSTEALILAALGAEGTTDLVGVAMEPEVQEFCNNLKSLGADISGIGTPFLKIVGKAVLHGGEMKVMPDRLETGTFAIMGALLAKKMRITKCQPQHLDALWRVLRTMGVKFELGDDWVEISRAKHLIAPLANEVVTHEYPGFATDLQAPLVVALTQAEGQTLVHETVYEGRLQYTEKLVKMGANIRMLDPHRVMVTGPSQLFGTRLESPDIRAGIALLIASLVADGESIIENVYTIDRGYAEIDKRLRELGGRIIRGTSNEYEG